MQKLKLIDSGCECAGREPATYEGAALARGLGVPEGWCVRERLMELCWLGFARRVSGSFGDTLELLTCADLIRVTYEGWPHAKILWRRPLPDGGVQHEPGLEHDIFVERPKRLPSVER
jgi:hypothetical protein